MSFLEPPAQELEYRCIGIIKGQFQYNEDGQNGVMLLDDGELSVPAFIINKNVSKLLEREPHLLNTEHHWTVFLRTHPVLRLQIKHLKNNFADNQEPGKDIISIRGTVSKIDYKESSLDIKIQRNIEVPSNKKELFKYKPFYIKVFTSDLKKLKSKQFIDITVNRQGDKLVIDELTILRQPKPTRRPHTRRPQNKPPLRHSRPEGSDFRSNSSPFPSKPRVNQPISNSSHRTPTNQPTANVDAHRQPPETKPSSPPPRRIIRRNTN